MAKVIALVGFVLAVGCGNGGGDSTGGGPVVTSSGAGGSATISGGGGAGGGNGGTGGAPVPSVASSASAGGMGGVGGIPLPECALPSECPLPTNMCLRATCDAGMCGIEPLPANTPYPTQIAGDCQVMLCNGAGLAVHVDDATDVQDDGNQCTSDTCLLGIPQHAPATKGAPCSQNGGMKCDGSGACVECIADGDCATGTCRDAHCVMVNGCSLATAYDSTGATTALVVFGGSWGPSYTHKCTKVSTGTQIRFQATSPDSLGTHPLMGGEVVNGVKVPATSGPLIPLTNIGDYTLKTFVSAGTFPYYCDNHALSGMTGVIYVVP